MNDIKAIRAQTGLSQTAFAKQYDIPLRTLQHWEAQTRTPAEYITKLLARLVSIDYPKQG